MPDRASIEKSDREVVTKLMGPGGVVKDAVELEIDQKSEPWILCSLSDGTNLKFRPTVMRAHRILNEYNPSTGEPSYNVEITFQMVFQVPARLKKLPEVKKPDNTEVA